MMDRAIEKVTSEQFNLDFERGKVFGLNWSAKIVEMAKEMGDDPVIVIRKMAAATDRHCEQQQTPTGSSTGP